MVAVHFTTITSEPNIANIGTQKVISIGNIRPSANNILYARFEVFTTLLCVSIKILSVFVR